MIDYHEERFTDLWNRIKAQSSAKNEFSKLKIMYSQSHRFYHNMEHVEDCLSEFDSVKQLSQQPDLVEFAIWYHDIIYDTKAKDNEEQSAKLAYTTCLNAELSDKLANRIKNLISATKHNVIPRKVDEKLLVDIDLSILGKSEEKFDAYEWKIRQEYSWVPEDQFKKGRIELLQNFLERSSIYSTDFFREKFEFQARVNLEKAIKKLC